MTDKLVRSGVSPERELLRKYDAFMGAESCWTCGRLKSAKGVKDALSALRHPADKSFNYRYHEYTPAAHGAVMEVIKMQSGAIYLTAASIAFIHTVLGPDHYVPFVALSKARGWPANKTALVTFFCGVGHVGSSVLIGLAGIATGAAVSRLRWVEGLRGDAAGWLLLSFGFAYMVWGVKKAVKGEKHSHLHSHGGGREHEHGHCHEEAHAHPHGGKALLTFWALFIVFVLGPCEPLIPVLMYPALKIGMGVALTAAAVFSIVTISAMLSAVYLLRRGISFFPVERMERYAHALAGFAIFACGIAVKSGL